ncbi:MAG: bifunctional aldolase/short-chain dehydrogenase [Magnetococcales bacterium]|nr:bifunctional aldolase/short-chain dehydrogenase [Magnetococcales bacterium]
MENRWSEQEAAACVRQWGPRWGDPLALRTYASRLLGRDDRLVVHGGGNTSVKATLPDVLGRQREVLFVKGSGYDLATIDPEGHVGLELGFLRELRALPELADAVMVNTLRTHALNADAPAPSIEALLHAFLPPRYIDHSHADAILALTNRTDATDALRDALGDAVIVLPYVHPGFALAKAADAAFTAHPGCRGMVLMHHGLITWGESAEESYRATIDLVTRAEAWLEKQRKRPIIATELIEPSVARERYRAIAPWLRGLLARKADDPDRPYQRVILRVRNDRPILEFLGAPCGREVAVSPPLTTDHLIRTKPLPMWCQDPADLEAGIAAYAQAYGEYWQRHATRAAPGTIPFDPLPRVILIPHVGVVCVGADVHEADIARDITLNTLALKRLVTEGGSYVGLPEDALFDMEYFPLQTAKLGRRKPPPLARTVAVVTGAAGAIGSGVCEVLLENGAHVAATDLPGEPLDSLVRQLQSLYPKRIVGVPMDVTDPDAVHAAFASVSETWGGIDLVVINAGLAHVAPLAKLDLEDFRRVARVNVEGTLNLLTAIGPHMQLQGTGGDVVLISTKNVFAPGAQFGAYSATKAASHQLARVASLELAERGVRVNMISPDAVFSSGERRSGLWAAVGPDRMRARGLDEKGLEEYYRNRNLLKSRVTARHVGQAVLFFATRQTPTTGATIPVDGGLPDATPR